MAIKDSFQAVQRAYKKNGFAGVWKWAKDGSYKRWRIVKDWSGYRLTKAKRRVERIVKILKETHVALNNRKDAQKKRDRMITLYLERIAKEDNPERRRKLEAELQKIREAKQRVRKEIKEIRQRRNRAADIRKNRIDEMQMWARKHVIYRNKWNKARKAHNDGSDGGQPTFEPWMANGKNWQDANQWARNFVARAVVIDGNYTTSMARTYVPPGGSSTSYHLVWNGGKAADVGPSYRTQQREYGLGIGNSKYYELYGPNNSQNVRYGQSYYMPEGSGIEQLHDTHNHGAGDY